MACIWENPRWSKFFPKKFQRGNQAGREGAKRQNNHESARQSVFQRDDRHASQRLLGCTDVKRLPSISVSHYSQDVVKSSTEKSVDAVGKSHETAFQRACSRISEEQIPGLRLLGRGEVVNMQDLLKQLYDENNEQSQEWLRKGLSKVNPYFRGMKFGVDLISPAAAVEPTASLAVGLVQSLMGISIAICGASEDFSQLTKRLLEDIKLFDDCDEKLLLLESDNTIEEALTDVYGNLLNIYIEMMRILRSHHTLMSLLKSKFQERLDTLTSSLHKSTENLFKYISFETHKNGVETYQTTRRIEATQEEERIYRLLRSSSEKEDEFLDNSEEPADDTCQWLTASPTFCSWRQRYLPGASCLVLFGHVGCGKTMISAHVFHLLGSNVDDSDSPKTTICRYHCRDDGERNKATSLYRSLLSQILKQRPHLKSQFFDWYHKNEFKTSPSEPTRSHRHLRDFLIELISKLEDWFFMIIDAIDECDEDSRENVLLFCKRLSEQQPRCKIFLTSRPSERVRCEIPPGSLSLDFKRSEKEDRLIAAYLVDRFLTKGDALKQESRQRVVEQVCTKADGSAIWMKMSLKYLRESYIIGEKRILLALEDIPEDLPKLYGGIFDQVAGDGNRLIIQQALEILAVAVRPMTLQELSYATTISMHETKPTNFSELLESVQDSRVLNLIQPFIRANRFDNPIIRLDHNSLKQLILEKAPPDWTAGRQAVKDTKGPSRAEQLHNMLSATCIRYLMFPEFRKIKFLDEAWLGEAECNAHIDDLMSMDLFDDNDDDNFPTTRDDTDVVTQFVPSEKGFGALFTYAACHWPDHARNCSENSRPSIEDVTTLASPGSMLLRNWIAQYERPSCWFTTERPLPQLQDLNPLVIAACFGLNSMVIKLLENNSLDRAAFTSDSAYIAANSALLRGHGPVVETIFERTDGVLKTWNFLHLVIVEWRKLDACEGEFLNAFYEKLVKSTRRTVIDLGPRVLCFAAEKGCLPIIKALFQVGEEFPELRKAILEDRDKRKEHQSIGVAARWYYSDPQSHADVIRFLCEQKGIEQHLRHQGPNNETVYHIAAQHGDITAFQILFDHFPEGADLKNADGDTPLSLLVFSRPDFCSNIVEYLIQTCGADPNTMNGVGNSPLMHAVSKANLETIRMLVACGAHLDDVLGSPANGKPYLKHKPNFSEDEDQVLEILCQLKKAREEHKT